MSRDSGRCAVGVTDGWDYIREVLSVLTAGSRWEWIVGRGGRVEILKVQLPGRRRKDLRGLVKEG